MSKPDAGEDVSDGSGKGHDDLVDHLKNRAVNYIIKSIIILLHSYKVFLRFFISCAATNMTRIASN